MDEITHGQKVNIANAYQTLMPLITWMSKDNMDDSMNQIEWNLPHKCSDSTNVFIKSNEEKSSYVPTWFMIIYVKSQNFAFFMSMLMERGKGFSR